MKITKYINSEDGTPLIKIVSYPDSFQMCLFNPLLDRFHEEILISPDKLKEIHEAIGEALLSRKEELTNDN